MLQYCAQWQRNALMLRQWLAAQCLDFAPNGGAMLGFCPRWQHNDLMSRPMAGSATL
jgi:hypothetical protein